MAAFTLITGASQGLGTEFARLAVKDKRDVILSARESSRDRLEALAQDLRQDTQRTVLVIPADLATPTGAADLWDAATADGRQIDMLVNNAGLGSYGPFAEDAHTAREMASLQVNLVSATILMKRALLHMRGRGSGRVLNIASLAGFFPGPNLALYHATKAYLLSLSEAVADELRGTDVTVTVLCPGLTHTNFMEDAQIDATYAQSLLPPMTALAVAEQGWRAARLGKRTVVSGLLNKLIAVTGRLLPRRVMTRLAGFLWSR